MVSLTHLKVGAGCWLGTLVPHVAPHPLVDEIGFLTGQCQGGSKRGEAASLRSYTRSPSGHQL